MTTPPGDPDRRRRWFKGTAASMLFSLFAGFSSYLAWADSWSWQRAPRLLTETCAAIAFAFWIIFPIVYINYILEERRDAGVPGKRHKERPPDRAP